VRTGGPARQVLPADVAPSAGASRAAGHLASPAGRAARQAGRIGRTSFVLLVLGLLGGGLVCLLVVNTTLAANSIEITNLQQANAAHSQQVQQLEQQVTAAQSAAVLEKEALKLGLRPDPSLTFLDLRTGSVRNGQRSGRHPRAPAGARR